MNSFFYILEDTLLNHGIRAPQSKLPFCVSATGKLCTNAHVCTIVYIILYGIEVKLGESVEASAGSKLFLYIVACMPMYPKKFFIS